MDYSPLFAKLFELTRLNGRKLDLYIEINNIKQNLADLHTYINGFRGSDSDIAQRERTEGWSRASRRREELAETQREFGEVCAQIVDLEEQIEAEIKTPVV